MERSFFEKNAPQDLGYPHKIILNNFLSCQRKLASRCFKFTSDLIFKKYIINNLSISTYSSQPGCQLSLA
jgi:hypothetical protein